MERIDISGITPVETLFHNEKIKTFQKKIQLAVSKIKSDLGTIIEYY